MFLFKKQKTRFLYLVIILLLSFIFSCQKDNFKTDKSDRLIITSPEIAEIVTYLQLNPDGIEKYMLPKV